MLSFPNDEDSGTGYDFPDHQSEMFPTEQSMMLQTVTEKRNAPKKKPGHSFASVWIGLKSCL